MIFLFPRWDMLIPWRVCMFITPSILMSSYIPQLVEASFRGRKAGSEVPPLSTWGVPGGVMMTWRWISLGIFWWDFVGESGETCLRLQWNCSLISCWGPGGTLFADQVAKEEIVCPSLHFPFATQALAKMVNWWIRIILSAPVPTYEFLQRLWVFLHTIQIPSPPKKRPFPATTPRWSTRGLQVRHGQWCASDCTPWIPMGRFPGET